MVTLTPLDDNVGSFPVSKLMKGKHYEFNGANVPGYDQKTGTVAGGALDNQLQENYHAGLREAAEFIPGALGDVGNLLSRGAAKVVGYFGASPETQTGITDSTSGLVSSQDIRDNVTDPLFGKSETVAIGPTEQLARTSGQMGPGAFVGGGLIPALAGQWLPTAGSELLGMVAPEGYEDYFKMGGALLGGGFAAGGGGAPLASAARDIGGKPKDVTRLIKLMQDDGYTPAQIKQRLSEMGPDSTLLDVGPNLRQEGQRIHAAGGPGRGVINDTITQRDAGANTRIQNEINQNLGPAIDPAKIDAGLKGRQKALPYTKTVEGGVRVETQALDDELASMAANETGAARAAIDEVRKELRIRDTNELDPHPRKALNVRHSIDGKMRNTQDTNVQRVLTVARKKLDAELGKSVPGIKELDAKFAGFAQQRDAVKRGQTVLDSGRTSPWPDALAKEAQNPAIKGKLAQGARADIERIVGTNANDRVALQRIVKGEGDWNRQKLATLFGQEKADKVIAVLDREGAFAETSNRVVKNSATAERLPEGRGGMGVVDAYKAGGTLGVARAGGVKAVEGVLAKLGRAASSKGDERMARILASTDAQKIVTTIMKANGGKPLPAGQMEEAVRKLLLTNAGTGASSQ